MTRHFRSLQGHLLCTCVAAVLPATASLAQVAEEDFFDLGTITVEMQDDQQGAADRATAVYVSDAELERARMGNVKDLFAGIASVSVGGAIPVAQKIFVNGIDMLNLSVQIDGALQNNRTFHHTSANVFDPGMLKFVRVDPGIAAADTGPNAIAGAVIMETIGASDFLGDDRSFGGNVRLSFADNGDTFGRAVTLAGQKDGFEVLGYFKNATGNDYVDGNGNLVDGTAADMQSGLLKLAYESDQGHRIEFSGQKIVDDTLRPYRANIGEVLGGRPVPATRVYDTERSSYSLRYENTNDTGMWDPEFVLGYSESVVKVPDPYGSMGTSDTLSAKLQNTFHLSSTGTIVAGLDYYDRHSEYSDPTDPYLDEGSENIGLFAQARFDPTNRWSISTGLRYDRQEFVGWDGYTDDVSGASANISAAYSITDALSVRAGYSNVFGGIQLEDNYQFWERWDYTGLKPSRSENYTVGFDYNTGSLTLGGELFLTDVRDARSGAGNFDFESKGFNLGAVYGWTNGSMRLTYSNSDVKVNDQTGGSYEALDFGAPLGQVVAFELQQAIPQWDMLVGGSMEIAMDYDTLGGYSDRDLEGYQVVNIFAEYHPPSFPALTLRASIDNLFDEQYADRATYGGDYTDVVTLKEPGRTFRLEAIAYF
ncbi:TonB-dependent receptor [Shimia thalassica]|uniref:TonB-dependent receptor plug domain-containing protein n=1 Tax=Shimia thalassica TaxID=1715693 RepID=UPI0027340DE0|nr:TonB-dependent receptor [Shimia thalassica]MDP2579964.1 TonB-dependent receptor [Shimia thalassica]